MKFKKNKKIFSKNRKPKRPILKIQLSRIDVINFLAYGFLLCGGMILVISLQKISLSHSAVLGICGLLVLLAAFSQLLEASLRSNKHTSRYDNQSLNVVPILLVLIIVIGVWAVLYKYPVHYLCDTFDHSLTHFFCRNYRI